MTLTLLLDLDDTLLDTNVPAFAPAYFSGLASQPFKGIATEKFAPAIREGTRLMNESADPSRTMQDVFESYFYPQINILKESVIKDVEHFYDEFFPTLRNLTSHRPDAISFMDWAFSMGYKVAIATDPLLPRKAAYQRLQWAGFDPKKFELISSFEDFHFSKTYPAYYAEILGRLGWPQGPVLMVGNDPQRDISPAKKIGLATYHLISDPAQRSEHEASGQGTFSDLRSWLESIDLKMLEPDIKAMDAFIPILTATPAALSSLVNSASTLKLKPASDEWAFAEILCHFRDVEVEINTDHILRTLKEQDPFLSLPDTHQWAEKRKYVNQNATTALQDFITKRMELISLIEKLTEDQLKRTARHSIFGPTNLQEIIAFMVEHDRLHVHQVWKLLNPSNN